MKKMIIVIALAALLGGLAAGPVPAQDKAENPVVVKGSVTAGVQAVGEVERSSKFTEYRDVPRGTFVQALALSLTKGDGYFRLAARNLVQADQRLLAEAGRWGTFHVEAGYAETPHRFSFFGATPYVERTPGVFTLNDVIRSDAEALVPTGTSTNIAAARALVSSFLTSAGPIDLGLRRKKMSLAFAYTPSLPLSVNISADHEARSGNRPYGAPLGFSNAIEVPEPIHYETTNLDTNLEYHKRWGTLRAGLAASFFENDVQTLIWDNPYRITDSTYASAYSAGNGTAHGRMSLPPSNDAVRFYASGSVKPVAGTRISAAASYSLFNQNQKLLPFTINTAIPGSDPNAIDALTPPRERAQAKAGITSLDLTVSSRLTKDLSLAAGVRYYDFANRLTALDLPLGYTRLDQVWEDVPIAIEPYSFDRTRLFGDLTYRAFKKTSITAGYTFSSINRHEGGQTEKNRANEGAAKVAVDSQPLDWLSVRVSFLDSRRTWSLDDTFVAYVPGFNFKRYYETARNRQALNALVGLSPFDRLDVQLTYSFGHDKYPKTTYGLTKDDFDMVGVDVSYELFRHQSLYAFYTREVYAGDQADRQTSGDVFSTNPANDWTARLKDTVNTFGAGQAFDFSRGKLGLDLSGSYSRAYGASSLFSPPGGTPDVAVNFTRPLDTTSWWTIQSAFKWRVTKQLTAILAYWYEAYTLVDIVRNDVAVDYASAGGIFLGALEPGYKYHVGSLRLVYGW